MKLRFTRKAVRDYEALTLKLQELVDKQTRGTTKRYPLPILERQEI